MTESEANKAWSSQSNYYRYTFQFELSLYQHPHSNAVNIPPTNVPISTPQMAIYPVPAQVSYPGYAPYAIPQSLSVPQSLLVPQQYAANETRVQCANRKGEKCSGIIDVQ